MTWVFEDIPLNHVALRLALIGPKLDACFARANSGRLLCTVQHWVFAHHGPTFGVCSAWTDIGRLPLHGPNLDVYFAWTDIGRLLGLKLGVCFALLPILDVCSSWTSIGCFFAWTNIEQLLCMDQHWTIALHGPTVGVWFSWTYEVGFGQAIGCLALLTLDVSMDAFPVPQAHQ